MKQAKRTIVILSLALASCRGPVFSPTATPQTFSVRIVATTATYPLLRELAAGYERPGILLAVDSAAASWDTIYGQLIAGDAPFALTTYLPSSGGLWAAPIGQDGIAVIVHPATSIAALTVEDVRRIFTGQVTTWAELGGADQPVVVVSRDAGADTRHVFDALVLGERDPAHGARLALSSQGMVATVARTPGAVGYVSMALVTDQVRAVALAAAPGDTPHLPTPQTVSQGLYPLRAPVLVTGPDAPEEQSAYRDWFAWMQSSAGQAIVGQQYGTLYPAPDAPSGR